MIDIGRFLVEYPDSCFFVFFTDDTSDKKAIDKNVRKNDDMKILVDVKGIVEDV